MIEQLSGAARDGAQRRDDGLHALHGEISAMTSSRSWSCQTVTKRASTRWSSGSWICISPTRRRRHDASQRRTDTASAPDSTAGTFSNMSTHPRRDPASPPGFNLHPGLQIVYRELGEGAPVLFVHGTLAGMDTFRRQLLWFGHRARAIAYSRRFHPPSGPDGAVGPSRPPVRGRR